MSALPGLVEEEAEGALEPSIQDNPGSSETPGKRSTESRHLRVSHLRIYGVNQMWWYTPGNPGTWEMEAQGSGVQGLSWLHSEFESRLGHEIVSKRQNKSNSLK